MWERHSGMAETLRMMGNEGQSFIYRGDLGPSTYRFLLNHPSTALLHSTPSLNLVMLQLIPFERIYCVFLGSRCLAIPWNHFFFFSRITFDCFLYSMYKLVVAMVTQLNELGAFVEVDCGRRRLCAYILSYIGMANIKGLQKAGKPW